MKHKPRPTLYIAGPMRGYPEFNFPAFAKAAADLRAAGYGIVSPHELHSGRLDLPWNEYMRRDIAIIVSGAIGGLAMLPGWQDSRGAKGEAFVGELTCLPIRSVDQWLEKSRGGAK